MTLSARATRHPRPKITASQSVMDYFRKSLPKTHAEVGSPYTGVAVAVNDMLPPDWMVIETAAGTRYFKLHDGRLVEMVPPPVEDAQ